MGKKADEIFLNGNASASACKQSCKRKAPPFLFQELQHETAAGQAGIRNNGGRRLIAFGWYGGKFSHMLSQVDPTL